MSGAFMKGVSYTMKTAKMPYALATKTAKGAKKAQKAVHAVQQKISHANIVRKSNEAAKKLGGLPHEYAVAPAISSTERHSKDLQDYSINKSKDKEAKK
jgi:hypothetical protein